MKIYIESLEITALIGILEHERKKPQRVIADITLEYAPLGIEEYLDYSVVVATVTTMLEQNHYGLLEEALESLQKKLLEQYDAITMLRIKLAKPDILPNSSVGAELEWVLI